MEINELNEKLDSVLNEAEQLYEMVNLAQEDTGLSMVIWVDTPIGRAMKHNKPRIKFQANKSTKAIGPLCSMSIEDEPQILNGDKGRLSNRDINILKQWIVNHKEDLLAVWNGKMTQVAFAKKLEQELKG